MVTIPAGNVKQIREDFTTFKTRLIYLLKKTDLPGGFIDFFHSRPRTGGLQRNSAGPMFVGLGLFLSNGPEASSGQVACRRSDDPTTGPCCASIWRPLAKGYMPSR